MTLNSEDAGSPVGPGAGNKAVVFSVAFLPGRTIVILPNPTSCFGPCAALVYCFSFRTSPIKTLVQMTGTLNTGPPPLQWNSIMTNGPVHNSFSPDLHPNYWSRLLLRLSCRSFNYAVAPRVLHCVRLFPVSHMRQQAIASHDYVTKTVCMPNVYFRPSSKQRTLIIIIWLTISTATRKLSEVTSAEMYLCRVWYCQPSLVYRVY